MLDTRRREFGLTWVALDEMLRCSPARLTNLKTAREADMALVVQLLVWIDRPSTDSIHAVAH